MSGVKSPQSGRSGQIQPFIFPIAPFDAGFGFEGVPASGRSGQMEPPHPSSHPLAAGFQVFAPGKPLTWEYVGDTGC
jgi:hypothetical protein